MYPPIAAVAQASAGVRAVLKTGNGPVRFWPFGEAPQKGNPGYRVPYAVFQTVYGSPNNLLACIPSMDTWGEQVDVYGETAASVRAVAEALRDAFEPVAYIVSWNGEFIDEETNLRRYSFTVEFMTPRT